MQFVDLIADKPSFIMLVIRNIKINKRTISSICPEILFSASLIVIDDSVSSRQNILSSTVILLQKNSGRIRKITLKLHNVADSGASECVNGLVCVTYNA